jgi:dGTP triphosphohydrolase
MKGINGDEVNQMNSRGRNIINSLYKLYRNDTYCFPSEYKIWLSPDIQEKLQDTKNYPPLDISEKDDIKVICDYIASLTDQEAIDRYRAILI